MIRVLLTTIGIFALTFAGGCQMSGSAGPTASTPQKAVLVSGGNSGGTVVFLPSNENGKVIMLSTSGTAKVCPECEADAAKYFATGELVEKCPMCGATRTVLTLPPTNVGHQ